MQFADNAGPDQPAQMCRLILAFIVCIQNGLLREQRMSRLDCIDAPTHLDHCYSHVALGSLSHVVHHTVKPV